ncbi:Uncharacterized protein YP598_2379 [Yersinia pseudotuberculosis]|uniref:Uncharacterized protein n=1 Tax=Yersinia pseudotuberculosis serotype O:1b (strain IP 31758) TaxID=349747 RepID=A0A0U1R0N6_YERP3|nr:hypothetical protein YpsIP31758_2315 [Yersinia pseudotuberculosis IP 31758]UFA61997.1 Uncharacterized protein YP598_2379 [Yersinia pseudotuberculosis]
MDFYTIGYFTCHFGFEQCAASLLSAYSLRRGHFVINLSY